MKDLMENDWNRTNRKEKISIAENQLEKAIIPVKEIITIVESCLNSRELKYTIADLSGKKAISKWDGDWQNSVFLSFTKDGRVAVVGAGEKPQRFRFPKVSDESDDITAFLMAKCREEWPEDEKKRVIRIEFTDLKGQSKNGKDIDNLLKCRDGVECLIGEALLEKGVPIINTLSHRNWKYQFWKKWKEKDFFI